MNIRMAWQADPGPAGRAEQAVRQALDVLIVDDQPAVRRGLIRLLQGLGLPGMRPVEAASLEQARARAQACRPHLVLLDVDLAGDDGLELIPQLAPQSLVIVLSSHAGDAGTQARAQATGAAAVMHKGLPGPVLAAAIRDLLARRLPLSGSDARA